MPTATNPTTGERVMLSGGQWIPYSEKSVVETAAPSAPKMTATNPQTGERVYLDEKTNQWAPIEKPGMLETAGRGLVRGLDVAGESFGGAMEMLRIPGGKYVKEIYGERAKRPEIAAPSHLQEGTVVDKPERLADPLWWVNIVSENLPNMALMMAPGAAAYRGAKALGFGLKGAQAAGTVGAGLGAFSIESGSAYNDAKTEMLQKGYSEEQTEPIARTEGAVVGTVNALLEAAPFSILIKNPGGKKLLGRIVRQALWEGGTEMVQENVNMLAAELGHQPDVSLKDWIGRTIESGLAGAVLGGGAGIFEGKPLPKPTETVPSAAPQAAPPSVRPPVEQSLGLRQPVQPEAVQVQEAPVIDPITRAAQERQRIIDRTYLPAEEEADRNRLIRQTLGLRGPDAADLSRGPGPDIQQANVPLETQPSGARVTGRPEEAILQPGAIPGRPEVRGPVQEPEGQVERRKEASEVITPEHIESLKGLGYDYDDIFLMNPRDADYIIETGRKPGEIDTSQRVKGAKAEGLGITPKPIEKISAAPITPTGDRWTPNRGSMPGEPFAYLDGDEETGKIALIERTDDQGNVLYEASTNEGQGLGVFQTAEEAAKAAEAKYPKEPTPKAKEPWEMGEKEFWDSEKGSDYTDFAGRKKKWGQDVNDKQSNGKLHKELVKKALSEGRNVPPEVLKDYPDLSPPPVSTEAAEPERAPAKSEPAKATGPAKSGLKPDYEGTIPGLKTEAGTEFAKATPGKAWIDDQQRPIYAAKKAKGKRNKGKVIVTLALGKTKKIDESKIIEWPTAPSEAAAKPAEAQAEKKPALPGPSKPTVSKIATLRGMIKKLGRINPLNFKG